VGIQQPDAPQETQPLRPVLERVAAALGAVLAAVIAAGCAQNELGRYSGYYQPIVTNPQRVRNAIVKSENYWIQKEVAPEEQFPGPTPDDLKASEQDYILGPGDLIDVTVFELMAPGQPYFTRVRISQSGQITFPYIGSIKCAGLTTRGLEEKLSDLLSPDYLASPQVTVFVTEYRNLNVSVLNGVARPGLYPMTKQDMTLLELVAMAGGVMQLIEDYGYVIRKYAPEEADMLALEAGVPPPEGEAVPPAKTPAETARPPGEKAPAAGEKAPSEKAPAPPEKAPAAGEKAPPEKAPAAGEPPPAATGATKAPPTAAPEPPKAPEKPAPAPAPADSAKDARELLEKMAAGELPAVRKIEAAEAAAAQKPAAAQQKNAAAEAKSPPPPPPVAKDEKELTRWIWSDGKWVEVKTEAPPAPAKPPEAKPPAPAKPPEAKPPAPAKPPEAKPPAPAKPPEAKPPEEGPALAVKPPEAKPAEPSPPPAEPPPGTAVGQLEEKLRRLGVIHGAGQLRRIIRFDVRALQAGDPTQNVVLRDGDVVTIPSPLMGDFYMAGEVARPGVYSLTGRKITLLQAVAAAGGLTAVAVPWRTEVVRRIAETEEEIIYVDLIQVARGEVPDFYVQPEDLIRVGTDQGAIYNAVIRNAFRATYGAGFVYDMNFADFYPWSFARHPLLK